MPAWVHRMRIELLNLIVIIRIAGKHVLKGKEVLKKNKL
jgi:hypothetical protein